MHRRSFVKGATLCATGVGLDPSMMLAAEPASPRSCLVMDAMGEIRPTYGPELIREILDSGVNAVTVTLCDPKVQEQQAFDAALEGVLVHDRYIDGEPALLVKATSVADVDEARRSGRLALFYLFQNSTQFGRDLDRVELFYRLGLRSCQLTYNHQNWAGAGCKEAAGSGLTVFGRELVERLNAARILIDLSHANARTMMDAIAVSKAPVVISHTGCMSVFENVRNTADEQLRSVADAGGVVGICQIRPFLTDLRAGSLERYFAHIDHAVKVAGVEHVCIGSDRDHRVIAMTPEYVAELEREEGANFNDADWPLYIEELNGPRRMEAVWDGLVNRGYSEADVEKVMGQNLRRVYRDVIG